MELFAGHFVVVTGGGGGIGRAMCRAFAREGAAVWAVGRNAERLKETVSDCGGRGRAYVADLTDDAQVDTLGKDAAQDFGRVDILVHAAGTMLHGPVSDSPVEGLDAQFRSNVRVPYRVTQRLLPLLRARAGQIVFVNSSIVFGSLRNNAGQYAATQHASKALAEALRQEVNADGIRVLCIYPGRTATSLQQRLYAKTATRYRPELLLQPEEIATMVVAALSLPRTAEVTDINIRPMLKSY